MYLALTTCNRFDILQQCMKSLLSSSFPPGTNLFIVDDCSNDARVKEYLISISKQTVQNLSIELTFNQRRWGCNRNMVSTIRDCFRKISDQFVITIDSDAIYNPQWIIKLLEAKDSVKDDKIGALTVYDSSWHKTNKEYNNFLKIKDDVGGFACMLNRDLFMLPELRVEAWDWAYCDLCKSKNYLILCTLKSYAQHIGKEGEHSYGNDWDHANNFVGEQ